MSDAAVPSNMDPDTETAQDDSGSGSDSNDDRTVIRSGRAFEQEYRLSASEAGQFLIDLGEQLRDDDELTVVDDEWELPFAFGEPVELELDYDGVGDPELEIELELPGRSDEKAPDVE
jgi:amphi-Trp domain-containing protein